MAVRLDEVAALCGGAVVRAIDLHRHGVAPSTVSHRCRAGGPWQLLLPGIVLLHNGPPTRSDRRRAALLYAGPTSVLTGADALELHGMNRMPRPSGPVHLLVPADVRRAGSGRVLAERTDRLPVAAPGRWPLAPEVRAVLDLVRRIRTRGEVRAAIAEVVQRGRCTPAELNTELAAGSRRGSALPREVLREVSDGVRSVAEAQARALLARSGLPQPIWNPRLYDRAGGFVAMPDAWFDDVGMAWEIDSLEWHLGPQDYARTLDRRAAMMSEGVVVVHHLPRKLTHDPMSVLRDLAANHAHAAKRPRPPLLARPSAV
jgi:hypothetical protein